MAANVTTLAHHLANPEVTIEAHTKARQIELARGLPPTAVYLDTKFWLIARDVVRGLRSDPVDVAFVDRLAARVVAREVFCPISETVFLEVMKQADRSSRRATAELVDAWSAGVTLIPAQMRIGTEIAHFFHAVRYPGRVHALEELVWSKLSYVLGYVHPSETPFDAATEVALQKAFLDHMWERPLVEIFDHLAGVDGEAFDVDHSALAQSLNAGVAAHAHTIDGFAAAYEEEVRGVVDLLGDVTLDVVASMAAREGIAAPLLVDRPGQRNMLKNLLVVMLKAVEPRRAFRTVHVLAMLHAAVRANRGRKFKPNDLPDFDHAAASLGYCDAFFTDHKLRKLLTLPPVELDTFFACRVVSEVRDAVQWLEALPAAENRTTCGARGATGPDLSLQP